jgi:hypothetical protein
MAMICARCGTQNPDGNQFCQACGTPLVGAAAAPIGATAASPFPTPATPVGPAYIAAPFGTPPPYQTPYYAPTPAAPQPQIHRTPWVLMISVIVGLIVVMAGGGVVLGATGLGPLASQDRSAQPLTSPSPAATPGAGGSPSPSPSPTHAPTGPTVSNANVIAPLPAGWTVLNKDGETITLESPGADGTITIGSGPSSPTQNAQQNKDTVDKYFESKYPDTKSCPGSKSTSGSLAGVGVIAWELCFTLTSGGQSVQAGAPLYVGANSSGSVYYAVFLITSQANINNFINEASPVMKYIQWRLK